MIYATIISGIIISASIFFAIVMNIFTIFQFISLGINLILCFYIISKHLNNKIGYAYLYIAISMTVWSLGDTLEMTAGNPGTAILWSRIGSISAIFVGISFIHF